MEGELPIEGPTAKVVRVAVSTAAEVYQIPGGTMLNELFGETLKRRQDAWLNALRERLLLLEHDFDRLSDSLKDIVVTVVQEATQLAVQSHEAEKRSWLLSAIERTIAQPADFDRKRFFLQAIARFQPVHIRVLGYFASPSELLRTYRATTMSLSECIKKQLSLDVDIYTLVEGELSAGRMIDLAERQQVEDPQRELTGASTELGREFLEFISVRTAIPSHSETEA